MKKLLVVIVGIFSLLMVYLSVKEVNIIQGTNLYLADYTIADYFNEKNYSLNISGDNFETIYNALIEFAGNEEITYVYSDEKNDDRKRLSGRTVYPDGIVTNDNKFFSERQKYPSSNYRLIARCHKIQKFYLI